MGFWYWSRRMDPESFSLKTPPNINPGHIREDLINSTFQPANTQNTRDLNDFCSKLRINQTFLSRLIGTPPPSWSDHWISTGEPSPYTTN